MALKPAGGKYEGVWINELKNGDTSFYPHSSHEILKPYFLGFSGVYLHYITS